MIIRVSGTQEQKKASAFSQFRANARKIRALAGQARPALDDTAEAVGATSSSKSKAAANADDDPYVVRAACPTPSSCHARWMPAMRA